MTFVAGFYTFTITLNHSDRDIFESFRLKIPRHELESRNYFYARLIAYLHSYRPGIEFSRGISEPKDPTIWQHDAINTTLLWIQVGLPEKRKLELSLKKNSDAEHRVYFYESDDLKRFCHQLRGSISNWVADIAFYQICQRFLENLVEHESSSPEWNISFIDNRIYLTIDDKDFESEIAPIDIWSAFQESLNETSLTGREGAAHID